MTTLLSCKNCLTSLSKAYKWSPALRIVSNNRLISGSSICNTNKKTESNEEAEGPAKYSQSEAAKWTAKRSFGKLEPEELPPRSQLPVVAFCTLSILIYFCVLREENDVDDTLRGNLTDKFPNLQESQNTLKDVEKLKKRMDEEKSKVFS